MADSLSFDEADEHVGMATRQLHEALCCARSTNRKPWQFAVELASLREYGISTTLLRWLVTSGFAEHGLETTSQDAAERTFQPTQCLAFLDRSCFVLTQTGEHEFFPSGSLERSWPEPTTAQPVWDQTTRELHHGTDLVKRFRGPAPNQEGILSAFEEDRWPVRIDDPLPPRSGQDPKRRLHDTINALNRNQKVRRIRFSGDGTGEGVCWQLIDDKELS